MNRVNSEWLRETVAGVRRVVTLDNHYVDGGQGQMLACSVARLGLAIPVTLLGVKELPVCGTNPEVLSHHRLDVDGLASAITGALAATT